MVLTREGRIAIAEALRNLPLHFAWGAGAAGWDDNLPPEETDAKALTAEIGRKTALIKGFAVQDPAGAIIVPAGRFSRTDEPTPHLYIEATFEPGDSPDATIRETAVFVGTATASGLPAGQTYFTPAQLTAPGRLLVIEHFPRFTNGVAQSHVFRTIVSI